MGNVLETLRERFRGRSWVPVTLGLSGARVWRVDGDPTYFVKTTEHAQVGDVGESLAAEAVRLEWLAAQGVRVPEIVDTGADEQFGWLVTTALSGRTASDPWPEAQREAVVDALADIAVSLHALPVDGCPFDRRLPVTVREALQAAESGRVDLDDLDTERAGWSAARLVDALVRTRPRDEDPVVCHGDFCLPNVLLDPDTLALAGLVDVGRAGVADRHADIALITRSIAHEMNDQFPPTYADRLIDRYAAVTGVTIDPERIAFYRLLDEFA
jgi:aminoglycoside phosphotransferase